MKPPAYNKVLLIGKLGKDPKLRYLDSGRAMAEIWVVVTDTYERPAGGSESRSEWVPVRLWGELAEEAQKHLRKGTLVWVEAQVVNHSWKGPQGDLHSKLEVVATQCQKLAVEPPASAPLIDNAVTSLNPMEALDASGEADEIPF